MSLGKPKKSGQIYSWRRGEVLGEPSPVWIAGELAQARPSRWSTGPVDGPGWTLVGPWSSTEKSWVNWCELMWMVESCWNHGSFVDHVEPLMWIACFFFICFFSLYFHCFPMAAGRKNSGVIEKPQGSPCFFELPWGHDPEPLPAVAHLRQEPTLEIPWKFLQFSPKTPPGFKRGCHQFETVWTWSVLNSLNVVWRFDPQTWRDFNLFLAVGAGWWGERITFYNAQCPLNIFKLGRLAHLATKELTRAAKVRVCAVLEIYY